MFYFCDSQPDSRTAIQCVCTHWIIISVKFLLLHVCTCEETNFYEI